MKLTKAFVYTLLTAGSVIVCGSALAQDSTNAPAPAPNGPPHMAPHSPGIDGLARLLNLTDAQKAQVQPIIAEQYRKMHALHNDTSLSVEDRRAKMKEIRDETSTKLQSILTPEQYDKWQTRMHGHRPRPQAPNVSTNAPAGNAP